MNKDREHTCNESTNWIKDGNIHTITFFSESAMKEETKHKFPSKVVLNETYMSVIVISHLSINKGQATETAFI